MLTIRTERADDRDDIDRVNREAFGQENEARLVAALRRSEAFIPELSLVAEEDGRLVGHILFSRIVVNTPSGPLPALALAPMAVLPAHQRRGIGSLLVRAGLEECRRAGHNRVIVVGHPDFYPRFGFVPAAPRGIRAPFEVPEEAFMVLEIEPGALTGVTGEVVYPREFGEV